MSTLTMPSSTMSTKRRAFAPIGEGRLRTMATLKNKQNALPSTPVSGVKKRAAPDEPAENIDDVFKMFGGSPKKVKAFDFDTSHLLSKPAPAFNLNVATPVKTPAKYNATKSLPTGGKGKGAITTDDSAPSTVSAGRSPKGGKRIGLLSNKVRNTKAINPPTSVVHKDTGVYSIADVLHQTIPSTNTRISKPESKPTKLKSKSRKGMYFHIHEDTADELLENLMSHSTTVLDISDDEGKKSLLKGDTCNKENVAPADYTGGVITRRDLMTDEPREPLGPLLEADYYGEGLTKDDVFWINENGDEVNAANIAAGVAAKEAEEAAKKSKKSAEQAAPVLTEQEVRKIKTKKYEDILTEDEEDQEIPVEIVVWDTLEERDEAAKEAMLLGSERAVLVEHVVKGEVLVPRNL